MKRTVGKTWTPVHATLHAHPWQTVAQTIKSTAWIYLHILGLFSVAQILLYLMQVSKRLRRLNAGKTSVVL